MDLSKPLAYRMCPTTLEEFVGQEDILGKNKILYRTIKADRLSSIILWGPPGCGKTSLAKVISNTTKYKFTRINAVTSGIAEIKKAIEEAKNSFLNPTGKCILFIDEIHRFNKLQQDALLPFVEDGTVILIGATTENPYFEVNKALISRSMIFKLNPLTNENIYQILKNSINSEKGLKTFNVKIEDSTLKKLAEVSNGDVRTALNGLEVAVLTTAPNEDGTVVITDKIIADSIRKRKAVFDKNGDSHYDNISAFIKSMRGSDPDATAFYLARAINRRRRSSIFSKKDNNCSSRRCWTC
jgi:putative ATPase